MFTIHTHTHTQTCIFINIGKYNLSLGVDEECKCVDFMHMCHAEYWGSCMCSSTLQILYIASKHKTSLVVDCYNWVQNRDFCYLDFLLDFLVTYILFLYLYFSFDVPSFIIITVNNLIEINNNNNNLAIRRLHVLRSNTQPQTEIKI
jgi:hypothetical protein